MFLQYKNNQGHKEWARVVLYSIITSAVFCLTTSFTDWITQAFIDPVLYLVLPGLLLKRLFNIKTAIVFLVPLLITYTIPSIYLKAFQALPTSALTIGSLFLGYYFHLKNFGLKYYASCMGALAVIAFAGMPNWLNYYFNSSPYCVRDFPSEILFSDLNRNRVDLAGVHKVRVLSFWSTRCGACIEEFPDFQEYYNEHKNDTSVVIYSVNINTAKDPVNAGEFLTKRGFDFPCLYMPNDSDRIKLQIQLIPALIIIDKNNKIRYFGGFHYKWHHFIHHIEDVVDDIKK